MVKWTSRQETTLFQRWLQGKLVLDLNYFFNYFFFYQILQFIGLMCFSILFEISFAVAPLVFISGNFLKAT